MRRGALSGRLVRRLGYPFVLLAIGAYAIVELPIVRYQPDCFDFRTVEGPLSEEFVLAITDKFALYGVHYAVFEATYTPKRRGVREDLPRSARVGRTWKIYTTLWHAHEGSWLPTAESNALRQVIEDDNGVTRAVIDERIAGFDKWIDGRYSEYGDYAFVRAIAIAPDSY